MMILLVLWVFQLAFLDGFYSAIKTSEIKTVVDAITDNVDHIDRNMLIDHLAYEHEVNIMLIDENGVVIYEKQRSLDSNIHIISQASLADYYEKATKNDGKYTDTVEFQGLDDAYNEDNYEGKAPSGKNTIIKSLIYVETTQGADGMNYAVIADAPITPIKATMKTLLTQLTILTFILIIIAVLFTQISSRIVAEPIIKLNVSAKELAKGKPNVEFHGGGYREIDELKETLNYASKEISALEHYRQELIANVSHDLRTPLTLIKGYSEMMKDIPSEATPENLQVVINEATRLTDLVNEMLSLSRLQEGGDKLELKEYDVVESLNKMMETHGKLIKAHGYELIWEHEETGKVYADEMQFTQVVYNLINNAVNYAGEDKKVVVKEFTHGENIRIEVTDNGEGIDVDILPHIWDRYFKSEKSHRRASVGTGLGLSIVKSVMNMHPGGIYGVITSKGEGSTFYVELPKVI